MVLGVGVEFGDGGEPGEGGAVEAVVFGLPDEVVGGYGEDLGELDDRLDGGGVLAALVVADDRAGDADAAGEFALGKLMLAAQGGDAVGDVDRGWRRCSGLGHAATKYGLRVDRAEARLLHECQRRVCLPT